MLTAITISKKNRSRADEFVKYMDSDELGILLSAFRRYYDGAALSVTGNASNLLMRRRHRGRYWLTFLVARYTGARISEILAIDDSLDIDFMTSKIRLKTLKRKKDTCRTVPVPRQVIAEIGLYLSGHPDMRGRIFKINRSNFFKKMQEIGMAMNLPKEKLHPNVLRHSRAVELAKAKAPLNMVQAVLGYASILNTSLYFAVSGMDTENELRDKKFA